MKNDPNLSGTIHIGIKTVKNRMFMVPMDTGFSNTEYRSFTKEGIDYFVGHAVEGGLKWTD